MKKIKFVGLLVIILIVALISFSASLSIKEEENKIKEPPRVDVTKENTHEVFNNGGSILEYNGYVYYLNVKNSSTDGFSNKICRRKLKENSKEEVIYDAMQYKLNDRLMIFNNNLFFNVAGQTLYMNLEDLNVIENYNKGILYSIQNGKIIYAYQGKIYKGEYYSNTLAIKSSSAIATVYPEFMFEDEKNLYFYSNNEDGSKSIFNVNKESQVLKILNRIYLGNAKKIEIIDYIQSNDNIYIAFEKTKSNDLKEYLIQRINKIDNSVNLVTLDDAFESFVDVSKENAYMKLKDSSTLYEYNSKKDEITKLDNSKVINDMYILKLNGKNIELYNNEKLLSIILRSIEGSIQNINIEEVGEYLYLKFDLIDNQNSSYEYMFYRLKRDGSNLEKLNDTF